MKEQTSCDLKRLISVARKKEKADLVLRGGSILNLFTGEIEKADVAICGEFIAGVGDYEGVEEIDVSGLFLTPGLIDSHMHLESTLLTPEHFAEAVLPLGTTVVVIDPHELANVAGVEGIRAILSASEGLPLKFYVMASSCVPASEFEDGASEITAEDIGELVKNERILGLGEVMDYPSVIDAEPDMLARLEEGDGKVLDGHAPGVVDADLEAYVASGIESDHETLSVDEGRKKLRSGLKLMIREGSAAKNLQNLIGLVNRETERRSLLVTDDLLPTDLEDVGHMNHLLSMAVNAGVSSVAAVRMATINAAEYFGLKRRGAIAPGYAADIVAFSDLEYFEAKAVIADGRLWARDGKLIKPLPGTQGFPVELEDTVHLPEISSTDIKIAAEEGECRVIVAEDGKIATGSLKTVPSLVSGHVATDVERDILKLIVIERYRRNGDIGLGLVKGFGLKTGALASTVGHDAHNLVVVGVNDEDILEAIREVQRIRGGLVAVGNGQVLSLPLPIGGLISKAPAHEAAERLRSLESFARELGSGMRHPFMTLSFMSLSVIPELKLTARGLIDARRHKIIGLFDRSRNRASDTRAG